MTAGSVPAAVAFGWEFARASPSGRRPGPEPAVLRPLYCPDLARKSGGDMLKFLRNIIVLRQIWRMWKGRGRG